MNDEQIIKKLSDVFNETLGVNEFELSITIDEVTLKVTRECRIPIKHLKCKSPANCTTRILHQRSALSRESFKGQEDRQE